MQRKEPFPGKIFTPCVPGRRFAGLFGCIARISCHSQLISDAWRANLATDCRPGTHFASIFPSASARERTVAESCHGLTLGDAPHEYIATASQAKSASGRNPAIVERPGSAYSQRLANGAASSCGRAYCLAIALVPHESDDLFVQAVLCTRERGATPCAWRRHIVAMAGNRTEGRGTLSRTWRGALNAGIRAEGADDKLAHALRQTGLHPSCRPTWAPSTNRPQHRCETRNESAGQANIERLRETDLRDRRKNGISGNDVHRPAAGSQGGFARRNSPE